jgi:hypothetical protein
LNFEVQTAVLIKVEVVLDCYDLSKSEVTGVSEELKPFILRVQQCIASF